MEYQQRMSEDENGEPIIVRFKVPKNLVLNADNLVNGKTFPKKKKRNDKFKPKPKNPPGGNSKKKKRK